jgi:hypothetical protein
VLGQAERHGDVEAAVEIHRQGEGVLVEDLGREPVVGEKGAGPRQRALRVVEQGARAPRRAMSAA